MNNIGSNSSAYFDVLAITRYFFRETNSNIIASEIHLFAYLACLLSLYDHKTISEWNYEFISTKNGHPFSEALDAQISNLASIGKLEEEDSDYYRLTSDGHAELKALANLNMYKERVKYIQGACSSLLAMPVGLIRNAISNDPELQNARILTQTRALFEEAFQREMHNNFNTLNEVIDDDSDDLMIPAVTWLSYLSDSSFNSI